MFIPVDKEIESNATLGFYAARHAAIDAQTRSTRAVEMHEDFFTDPQHVDRVEQTKSIVKSFFNGSAVYVNQRGLGTHSKRPFTVVKVEKPLFPNGLTQAQKDATLYDPLKALNVEVVFAKGSNSYLFRIR